MDLNIGFPFNFFPNLGLVWLLLIAALRIWFAVGVLSDAWELGKERPARSPELVGPIPWALATLVGGVFVAAVYWVVHRSVFHPRVRDSRVNSQP